jgi:hypothetical protein
MWFRIHLVRDDGALPALVLCISALASANGCARNDTPASDALASPAPVSVSFSTALTPLASSLLLPRDPAAFRQAPGGYRAQGPGYIALVSEAGARVQPTVGPMQRATSLELRTLDVRRHGTGSGPVEIKLSQDGVDGSVVLARDDVQERFRNSDAGLEQTWRFERAPKGRGALSIRVGVTGYPFAAATASGLHFVDPSSGIGLRYGNAIWIDARGVRTKVSARWTRSQIELEIPGPRNVSTTSRHLHS